MIEDKKAEIRRAKELHRAMKHQQQDDSVTNCACVLHGKKYDWTYVEKLRNMLRRNLSREVRMHVFTEKERKIPDDYIKHQLTEWPGISGPKKSWWYKMQMFDPARIQGQVLYLDLDVVIMRDISWIYDLHPSYFWAIHDFRRLWKPSWKGINSSMMYWDTQKYAYIWDNFCAQNIAATVKRFHGDQDYLSSVINPGDMRYLPSAYIRSWRWQIKDGGMDFNTRVYKRPDAGSVLDPDAQIIIFHGEPKPHQLVEPWISANWT